MGLTEIPSNVGRTKHFFLCVLNMARMYVEYIPSYIHVLHVEYMARKKLYDIIQY